MHRAIAFRRHPAALVLTARMGAGHDGVARELTRRLESRGFTVTMADVWDLQPPGLGRLITAFYRLIVQRAGWLHDQIYRLWLRPPPSRRRAPIFPVTRWAERRLARVIREADVDLAVTTFHLGTQMLGNLRLRRAVSVPTVSYCVDFAAHGLWVNPGVDLNLCLHPLQARRLAEMGARNTVVTGPVVAEGFRPGPHRRAVTRRRLGLGPSQPAVLLAGGSWGAGRLETAMAALERVAGLHVVAVTGENRGLRERLESDHPAATVLGWVHDMDDLMLACDVMVDNAGGLTAMEALSTGTPVVGFLPIPGHGRDNVAAMAEAGVSWAAGSEQELRGVIGRLTGPAAAGRPPAGLPGAMRGPDPVDVIFGLLGLSEAGRGTGGAVRARVAEAGRG